MVKISEFEEFLNAEMVKTGDILEILSEGKFLTAEETTFKRPAFQIEVKLPNGSQKTWTMNRTTCRRSASAYGDDSKDWIGRKVRVELLTQNVQGKMTTVIYGWPVEDERRVQTPLQTKTVAVPLESKGNRLVRFIKAYDSYKVEDVANLDAKTADGLILLRLAVPIDTVP